MDERKRWNWNIHYHRLVLDAIPPGAGTALDVGCGDGLLTFALADAGLDATGLDVDAASVERARERANPRTRFVEGDLFDHDLPAGSFDLVASISMLHHVDARRGLQFLRELVSPLGALVVVGFARPSTAADRLRSVVGAGRARARKVTGRYWEHSSPMVWPPPCTMAEMRDLVAAELPGARFRPLMPSRFAVVWSRPTSRA